jgi:two-component system, NtrC family, sensor histidine kinase HydH
MSFGLIALMDVVLGWTISSYLTKSMLKRETTITADDVERVVREHVAPERLRVASFSWADSDAVHQVAGKLILLPEVMRIKVFDHEGTVIWSDANGLIGMNFRDEPGLRESLQGKVTVDLEPISSTPEHRFEYSQCSELTSMYVPIRDETSGDTLAVCQIYKLPVLLKTTISQGHLVLWAIVLVCCLPMFLVQFGLISGTAWTINTQHSALRHYANELERINGRLPDTQAQLVEAERLAAIGEVTAAVAHGIRNPLGNIRLVSQEMLEGLERVHPLREPLGEILGQVDLLEARLQLFLNTTKPFDLSLTHTQVAVLIDNALEGIRQRLVEQDVTVTVNLEIGQTALCCDTVKIEEALQELLVNGVEAGTQTIRIVGQQVTDDTQRAWIRLTIDDDGVGLAPDVMRKAFQPFFTSKALGTGLGLVVARKIIEGHGGQLTLEEHASGGSRATVWLPSQSNNAEE